MAEEKDKDELITLDLFPREGERVLRELGDGNMVVFRERNNFLYVVELNRQFHMFSHTPGAPGGGQQQFPVNEKYQASVRKIAELADAAYLCVFDREMNLYGVLQAAEEGILAMFPGGDRDADEDIEFAPWDRKKKEKSQKMPTDG
ncbi:MAG: hypothetical protein LBN99_04965, partial [Oscillospiraceae bacterium]|nr:hypothetical protein [Oscillospiraceae bacterium]